MTNLITRYLKSKGIVSILTRIQEKLHSTNFLYRENEDESLQIISEIINSKTNSIHVTKSEHAKTLNEMEANEIISKWTSRLAKTNLRCPIQTKMFTPLAMYIKDEFIPNNT